LARREETCTSQAPSGRPAEPENAEIYLEISLPGREFTKDRRVRFESPNVFKALRLAFGLRKSIRAIEEERHKAETKTHDRINSTKLKKENIMAELIVVGFKNNMYRASEVLNELLSMNDDWVLDLHDAVAVYRDFNGKLRVDQSYQMTTGQGAALGGLWGLLIGATLAIPFTAGASAAAAAGAIAAGAAGGTARSRGWRR
jgi:hypothetical protein